MPVPPAPPRASADPAGRYWWWRRLLDEGPVERPVLEWIAQVRAAREALIGAYKPHVDGLLGIDRRDPRCTVRSGVIAEQWVVDVQDPTGRLVERFAASYRAEALAIFFSLHAAHAAPRLPGETGRVAGMGT